MHERTASDRHGNTSSAKFHLSRGARLVSIGAMAIAVFIPGCRSSSVHAAQATPDPSDVNSAAAQGACPTGQVLMSDGSCQAGGQAAPPPAAGSPPRPPRTHPTSQPTRRKPVVHPSSSRTVPRRNKINTAGRATTPTPTISRIPTTTRRISRTPTTTATSRAMKPASRLARRLRLYPSTRSRFAPARATCGTPATGTGDPAATTGYRESGCCLRIPAHCGPQDGGAS